MLLSAIGYALADSSFVVRGYLWVILWYVLTVFNTVYLKKIVDGLQAEQEKMR